MSESLLLKRQLEESLFDVSVVLFLFFLRVTFNALCVHCTKRMTTNSTYNSFTNDAFVEFAELKKEQPQLKNASENLFKFLELVEKFFPRLIHVNISLFPRDFNMDSSVKKSPLMEFGKTPDFVQKVLAFHSMKKLDWTNCCVFNLDQSRGPVVQSAPLYSVQCTAAYHAVYKSQDLIQARDYDRFGPHFADWEELRRKRNALSMVAVPLPCSKRKPIAVLGMASLNKRAFECDEVVKVLSTLLIPTVEKLLTFSTRRMELQTIVNGILTPIATHISQYPSQVQRPQLKGTKINSNGVNNPNRHLHLDDLISSHQESTSIGAPCSDPALNWADFLFNLVNLCFVYVYLSKVAIRGHTCLAMFLCFCVGIFDVVLLIIRYLCFDHTGSQGALVLGLCQIYRVIVIPVANTWMSWRVLNHFGIQSSFQFVLLLTLCLVLCVLLGSQVRCLLQVPVQILSIILAAVSTPDVCHRFVPVSIYPFLCLGIVSTLQVIVAYLIPTLFVQNLGSFSRNGEVCLKKGSWHFASRTTELERKLY